MEANGDTSVKVLQNAAKTKNIFQRPKRVGELKTVDIMVRI